ncbi:hypothetical protein ACG1VR_17415 [Cedecea davisae]|uniref:hypothetical protein n=1 Tax=Cedecea davisae TaxID=158484 RepID=UPI00376F1051
MDIIERYQPEFVTRFDALNDACSCPACANGAEGWPQANVYLNTQQRDSLEPGCESVARELLLNPQAFVLHISRNGVRGETALSPWDEALNQQCINLAIHPLLSLEGSLYAIGVLLSKARQYVEEGSDDPALLASMGEQLAQLAEHGVLEQQLQLLPPIEENVLATLKAMGAMRLSLNLPMAEKMSVMLKLSELGIMPASRLSERLAELRSATQGNTLFSEQPHILRNMLIYRLYHDVFPGVGCENYGAAFLALAEDFFQIKMLSAIWLGNNQSLTEQDVVTLFSAWFSWRKANPAQVDEQNSADYSLLCGLSLL